MIRLAIFYVLFVVFKVVAHCGQTGNTGSSNINVQIFYSPGSKSLELEVLNQSNHPILHAATKGTMGFRLTLHPPGCAAIPFDSNMVGGKMVQSLLPGSKQKVKLHPKSYVDLAPSSAYGLEISWGDITLGGAGVSIENLSLKTDANSNFEIESNESTKVTQILGIPNYDPRAAIEKAVQDSQGIVPIIAETLPRLTINGKAAGVPAQTVIEPSMNTGSEKQHSLTATHWMPILLILIGASSIVVVLSRKISLTREAKGRMKF